MRSEVYHRGKVPNDVMIIGEAPGREEASRGKPFVGDSGIEQDILLRKHSRDNITSKACYVTNVAKDYVDGNPTPGASRIARWTPYLIDEVRKVQPKIILAVGRVATQWFLGRRASMRMCHGVPHNGGAFDESIRDRACGAIVVPVYHPAWAMRDLNNRPFVDYDYQQAMKAREYPVSQYVKLDEFDGVEDYQLVEPSFVVQYLSSAQDGDVLSIDTETWPTIQFTLRLGEGFTVFVDSPDFYSAASAIQVWIDSGRPVVMHNAIYDTNESLKFGLDFSFGNVIDTMYLASLLRREPQSLKQLAWRWCGMRMSTYWEVLADTVLERQIDFLIKASSLRMPKCETVTIRDNDGREKSYTPQAANKKAKRILDKLADDGIDNFDKPWNWTNQTPLLKAWYNTSGTFDKCQAQHDAVLDVERKMGQRMPRGNLSDVYARGGEYAESAVRYASRDPDAGLRVYYAMLPELERRELA